MIRITCISAAVFAVAAASVSASEITVTSPKSDYLARVNRVLMPALLAELDKHVVNAKVTFLFTLDEKGHQSAIEVGSFPRDRAAEAMIMRTIRRLKFPPMPPGGDNGSKVVQIKSTLTRNR